MRPYRRTEAGDVMNTTVRHPGPVTVQRLPVRPALRASSGLLALLALAIAAAAGAAASTACGGALSGPPAMQGSARGTAYVLLFAAVPTIAAGAVLAWRGSSRGLIAAAGGLGYAIYNAVLLLFLTPYNRYFLLYVAALGTALWALVALLRATRPDAVRLRSNVRHAPRALAVFMLVVVAFNGLAWLRQILPSITAADPASVLAGTGVMTNAVWVQDLAVWLPVATAAALWLWRRSRLGPLIAGATLVYWVLESASIAVDQWAGSHADPSSPVVAAEMTPLFAVLGVVTLAATVVLLRVIEPGSGVPRSLNAGRSG